MRLDLSVACEVLQTKPRDLASPHPPVKMSRAVFVAGAALLLGASCFVLPGSTPRGAPEAQVSTGRAAGAAAPEAESATAAFSPLALGAALGLLAAVVGGRPALAADLENGEAIFNGNCTACHANGNNSIVAEKKLKPGCTQAEPQNPSLHPTPSNNRSLTSTGTGKIRKALNVFNDDISCLIPPQVRPRTPQNMPYS